MMQQTRVLCMLALTALSSAAVIGIDFGGEYIKAALVKPRVPLDIVVNPEGRRRTEAVVGFVDGEQFFGKQALGQVAEHSRGHCCNYHCSYPLFLFATPSWRLNLSVATAIAPACQLRGVLEDATREGS